MTDHPDLPGSSPEDSGLGDALMAWLRGDATQLDNLEPAVRTAADDLKPWLARLADDGPRIRSLLTDHGVSDPLKDSDPPHHQVEHDIAAADGAGADHGAAGPLADDPIAIALGLVVDPGRRLDSAQLTRARRGADLKPSHLARRLTERGWKVKTGEVSRWEQGGPALSPALVAALADILGVHAETLMPHRPTAEPEWLAEQLTDRRIAQALEAWATADGLSSSQVRQQVVDAFVGAQYRERQAATPEALLAVIAVLRQGSHRTAGRKESP